MKNSVLLLLLAATAIAPAQSPRAFTAADYARAERFMTYNTAPLVLHGAVRPSFLPNTDQFWYRVSTENGNEFVLVDPAKGKRLPAFDHTRLAAALAQASGQTFAAGSLPFADFEFTARGIAFRAAGKAWACVTDGEYQCAPDTRPASARPLRRRQPGLPVPGAEAAPAEEPSPNGKLAVYIRDYNLWVRDLATRQETQLTTDGVKDFGYATDNAGWTKSERPIVAWSPDSAKVATFRQDQRGVGEMYLVDTRVGHPQLQAWKYPLPGDEKVAMLHRVVIDVAARKVTPFDMPPDQHRSTLCDHIACQGEWADVQWSPDSKTVAFVSTSRDHKSEHLRLADAGTGKIRDIREESVATFFESGNGRVNWRYLPDSNELLWFSERDNWGHLYLCDLEKGRIKTQVTQGDWNVTQLLKVDEKNRLLYFLAVGREKGRDPYFIHLYRSTYEGKDLTLLTPENANHAVTLSPGGDYFVDSYSTPDIPPVTVLRDKTGKLLATLEKADISRLTATGWRPPVPVTVKARDGVTDLYGLMFQPSQMDPAKKYPIVNHIYPGPQTGSVGSRSFSPARGDTQALAELGFIVVEIDGMGTPWRSKKFHEAYFGDMGDNTLPDQVAGMKELAKRYPFIDIDRAGIYGHSGGGYAAAGAMFHFPDFFKVGISEAGNHDNRGYEDDWAEKWSGLLVKGPDGKSNYDSQANQNFAKNLKGKLLLAHGTMDANVPPYNTLLVVNELIKANKDFDLLMLPNRGHGFGNEPYMIRRRWDYFVRHLLGAEPPQGYQLRTPPPAGAF